MIYRIFLVSAVIFLTACGQALQIATPTALDETVPIQTAVLAEVPTSQAGVDESAVATTLLPVSTAPALATFVPVTPRGTPVVVIPTFGAHAGGGPWLAQQAQREDFANQRVYQASAPVSLLWYDPVSSQHLEIGRIVGQFPVTAQFLLKSARDAQALAVPYRIDQDYGLTAISPAIIDRMRSAGAQDSVEAYVLAGDSITPVATSTVSPFAPASVFTSPLHPTSSSAKQAAWSIERNDS